MCRPIELEIRRALLEKLQWERSSADQALASFRSSIVQVAVSGAIRGICRDPNDDMVLECAVNAAASVIVTGDKDLLSLGSYLGIRILTSRAFLDEFAP